MAIPRNAHLCKIGISLQEMLTMYFVHCSMNIKTKSMYDNFIVFIIIIFLFIFIYLFNES